MRTGSAPCAQAAAGNSSSASSAALTSFSSGIGEYGRRGALVVGDIDDLGARQAIGGAEPLAVARAGLAGDFIGGDRLAFLDDDLPQAAGVGLDHRHLAVAAHQI